MFDYSKQTCGVTGTGNISAIQHEQVKQQLEKEIELALKKGFRHFFLGLSGESGILFGQAILDVKRDYNDASFEILLPYRGWVKEQAQSEQINTLLQKSNGIHYACETKFEDYQFVMNNQLIDICNRIIVVYDEKDEESTSLVQIARDIEITVHEVKL